MMMMHDILRNIIETLGTVVTSQLYVVNITISNIILLLTRITVNDNRVLIKVRSPKNSYVFISLNETPTEIHTIRLSSDNLHVKNFH